MLIISCLRSTKRYNSLFCLQNIICSNLSLHIQKILFKSQLSMNLYLKNFCIVLVNNRLLLIEDRLYAVKALCFQAVFFFIFVTFFKKYCCYLLTFYFRSLLSHNSVFLQYTCVVTAGNCPSKKNHKKNPITIWFSIHKKIRIKFSYRYN